MRVSWEARLGLALVVASVLLYVLHFYVFSDLHHILIYGVGDVAFLPFEVLLVTLIIHRLLSMRERRQRLEKLNMVIGAFFSEVGTELLAYLSDLDPNLEDIRGKLMVTPDWSDEDFELVEGELRKYSYSISTDKLDLMRLKGFLRERRNFMLRLLENPNLLEHEAFTDLLQAVFHLTEELVHREDLKCCPDKDMDHLVVDIERVYVMLVNQWLDYMQHLKPNYPHLFSLAMRLNPFDKDASPTVK